MTRQDIFEWVRNEYGTEPEYLWRKFPDYAVLRNHKGKWYGLVAAVPAEKLGIEEGDVFEILNVKADPMDIDWLVKQDGFLRGYHMNKKMWLTVLLDGRVDDEQIKDLIAGSYEMTSRK